MTNHVDDDFNETLQKWINCHSDVNFNKLLQTWLQREVSRCSTDFKRGNPSMTIQEIIQLCSMIKEYEKRVTDFKFLFDQVCEFYSALVLALSSEDIFYVSQFLSIPHNEVLAKAETASFSKSEIMQLTNFFKTKLKNGE